MGRNISSICWGLSSYAFFIAGIASAFIYAKDTNPAQTAAAPKPPVTTAAPAETTGSGSTR